MPVFFLRLSVHHIGHQCVEITQVLKRCPFSKPFQSIWAASRDDW